VGLVDKDISSISSSDETETLLAVKPLHSAGSLDRHHTSIEGDGFEELKSRSSEHFID
jgi:hypothetical protein